ncbi:hypothetical protein SY88_22960 [Clostridiales bacterium PH28_bin88]|nr:hypothetical protein SY88_22960 [Clostridiales bacterium PH28_bin88]
MDYILVGMGGALGAITRYVVSKVTAEKINTPFPLGTWLVNITGAFFLSFLLGLLAHGVVLGRDLGPALTTGFLGAYTTFSTFSYEAVRLVEDGESFRALSYIISSVIFGLAAAWLGILVSIHLVS